MQACEKPTHEQKLVALLAGKTGPGLRLSNCSDDCLGYPRPQWSIDWRINLAKLKLPALDPKTVKLKVGYDQYYPAIYSEPCKTREWRALGDAVGLSRFSVNLTVLPPGA
jgi:hypothetical protein